MQLESIMRFGYALLTFTIVLMIWASISGAREIESFKYPPCTFNPLCTCSKVVPDLGTVQCRHVPFPAIPKTVNSSKVYSLHMEHTGLRILEPYFFQATGLFRLELSHNPITHVPDDLFIGLERSLQKLYLYYNELVDIPSRALRHLQKLTYLDLSGNQISCIESDSFKGLGDSLLTLILAQNSFYKLAPDSFSSLVLLETLDLSGNNIKKIDANVFRDGMPRLTKLYLSDNILEEIPYNQLSSLKMLRTLDLSHNLIRYFQPFDNDTMKKTNVKLILDNFHIEYNMIELLQKESFMNFDVANKTYLDGNPLHTIEDEAFRSAKIRELYIRNCDLYMISPSSFDGLGNSLQILDLSGNNITSLPENIFNTFDILRSLNLRENKMRSIIPNELFSGFQNTLLKLDLSGDQNSIINLQDLRRIRSIRSLSLTKLSTTSITSDDFLEFGPALEDLKITRSSLKSINANAFRHVRGIKRLDMSENQISTIDKDAFFEVGHSLISLKISHGLTMNTFPSDAFRHLTSLQELDLSNNKLKLMSDISFHFMRNLRVLELHDNHIEQVLKGTFQSDTHPHLEEIHFDFNNIKVITQHTFVELKALHKLRLDDNRIDTIEKRAFMNLDHLRFLSLRGNKLKTISDEGFQNLPELEILDMAYNSLTAFKFDYFDQVGTLSSLVVNASHNKIIELVDNFTGYGGYSGRSGDHGTIYHSNIRILDLSYNNISHINPGFFKPAEISLTHLYMSYNELTNTTRDIFGNMPHLQWLDLSNNEISEIDYDTFRNTKKLQVLKLKYNEMYDIPVDVFKQLSYLRVVDFSHNHLRSLPDNLFSDDAMESLNVSHNYLSKIPVTSLSNLAAMSICELDLSHNRIAAIHQMDLSNKFRSLTKLDLSFNYLFRLDDAAFATLPRLSILDLSDNDDLKVMDKAFVGLQSSLTTLGLNNISLITVPELPLPFLRVLRIANNDLPSVPQEFAPNMSALRVLDLSRNDLTNVPVVIQSLPQLRSLYLGGNSITTLTNTSFQRISDKLEHLDIAHLRLNSFESGALRRMPLMRSLKISPYPRIPNFNIPYTIKDMNNLRELWIDAPTSSDFKTSTDMMGHLTSDSLVQHTSSSKSDGSSFIPTDLHKEMDGTLPLKLRYITFSGEEFKQLGENVLSGIRSPYLYVTFYNTSISSLPPNFFTNVKSTQNISINFKFNNNNLKTIPNPNSASIPQLPRKTFTSDLRISGNHINCDCAIGWIEYWQRKKRQYMCTSQEWTENLFSSPIHTTIYDVSYHSRFRYDSYFEYFYNKHDCDRFDDDLREVKCSNKQNQQLMEVLKTDIECGWGSGVGNVRTHNFSNIELTVIAVLAIIGSLLWI